MSEILDYSPVPTLVVSPQYRVLRTSRSLLDAWGRGREDFADQELFTALYQGSPTERFDRIPFIYAIETAVAARALRLCYAAYVADGVSWTARIIPICRDGDNELLCVVFEWEKDNRDITVADGALVYRAPTDEGFRILIQSVKDYAIFLLDTRGNVATWNTGAELNKGYKKAEIVGKHFSIFYGEDDIRSHKPERELEICLREGRVEDEGWRFRKDGTRFWANVVITAVYSNGVHVGFGKVTRDLTERKEAELRLIAAYEESTRLKNDFLANISHEIRTPMHGMISACELLLDTSLTKDQRESANIIQDSGHVLLQVINDILDYSKLAAEGTTIKRREIVDVASIFASVLRSVQTTLQPSVQLRLTLTPDLPRFAWGDALRFRQIVQNLVGNAAKFTDKGSISSPPLPGYMIISEITDTGHGVSEEAALNLFKPFTQLDTTYQKRRQGTGLGLSIAKSLVERMDGEIGYRPNGEARGSVFWFTAQLGKLDSLQQQQQLEIQTDPSTSSLSGPQEQLAQLVNIAPTKRILAAEDNVINQKVLVGMLQAWGFRDITVVSDGAQAVSTLSSHPADFFDVLLMDISMPVLNGYEATARIRSGGARLPIIAMTAYALKGDMDLCLDRGMDDYISKPVNRQLFLNTLLKWLTVPRR
ncbi:hypothetical protein BX600DRAFT_482550 [Xylariales sp. PMI_506]|nr:hypothetical protein BX600DRAFT_482550 [Xylariales sp. PMI_506]